ncbi:O-methyltransferase [Saccharopolyspora antimicrobica]|uniref:O-methyltransferase n=1 Tax=Saccharopolyspora antimicrobica TaxID=455193 RepID=A0A1I5L011_9PSEU|nr:methyltransferase [Saccharopolyspora antimicrobica]RKT89079.1 O-methyltransferase [Saccharopolyspora antimicrobica]SFO90196.1 O-methyltransferase [Saccharopolyspora antimicrobica]
MDSAGSQGDLADSSRELAKLIDLATPFAIRVAVTMRLPELVSEGRTGLDELAAATGAHRGSLDRLLRHLVHIGLFSEAEPGVYGLTALSRQLLSEDGAWIRNWLDLEGPGTRMDLAFSGMLHSIRTGGSAYGAVHGTPFWDDYQRNDDLRRFFGDVMTAHAWQTGPVLAAEFDWSGVRTVIDVGGGQGALLAEIVRANPHLDGEVLDLPAVEPEADQALSEAGVAERISFVPGSFFDPLPPGRDVYVVSRVLTDWSDEDAVRILQRCAEAAGERSRVLIVEVLAGDSHAKYNTSFDLQSLVLLGGQERSVADFEALVGKAGLNLIASRSWPGGLVVVESRPRR